jgi:heme oxygenase-like protein
MGRAWTAAGGPGVAEATESALLRAKIELVLPALRAVGRRLIDHPDLRKLYPEYLFMSHCTIRASVQLMEVGLEASRARPHDPVCELLADYLEQHIEEERGHDAWLLEDLASIGRRPEEFLDRPPMPPVAALVGSQYYWVHHGHPVGLLGYIALLEGYPPVRRDVEAMQVRTGYGADAFRTLLLHADLDPHHSDELDRLLDSLPLTEYQRTVLGLSALSSVQLFRVALEELVKGS